MVEKQRQEFNEIDYQTRKIDRARNQCAVLEKYINIFV